MKLNAEEFVKNPFFQIAILLLGLIIYLLSPLEIKPYVGFLTGLYLIIAFLFQIKESVKERGIINELKDLFIAFVVVFLFFSILKIFLKTENPISAIASCSMVEELKRGDLIIISNAEIIKTQIEINTSITPLIIPEAIVMKNNKEEFLVNGSLMAFCEINVNELCKQFFTNPYLFSEKKGDVIFNYGFCKRGLNNEPCVTSLTFGNKTFKIDKEGDIIVFKPEKNTLFSFIGDTVHRAIVKINDKGNIYYLTKGDNNNVFDIQFFSNGFYNLPVKEEQVIGKVVFKIPYIGYYKLFITPYLKEDETCKTPLVVE